MSTKISDLHSLFLLTLLQFCDILKMNYEVLGARLSIVLAHFKGIFRCLSRSHFWWWFLSVLHTFCSNAGYLQKESSNSRRRKELLLSSTTCRQVATRSSGANRIPIAALFPENPSAMIRHRHRIVHSMLIRQEEIRFPIHFSESSARNAHQKPQGQFALWGFKFP